MYLIGGLLLALILVITFRAVFGPVIVLVGLGAVIVGAVAVKRGSVVWARVPTKQAGWLVVVAGIVALIAGAGITPKDNTAPTSASAQTQISNARPLVAAAPKGGHVIVRDNGGARAVCDDGPAQTDQQAEADSDQGAHPEAVSHARQAEANQQAVAEAHQEAASATHSPRLHQDVQR